MLVTRFTQPHRRERGSQSGSCVTAREQARARRLTEAPRGGHPEWTSAAVHTSLSDLATSLQSGLGKITRPVRVAVTGTAVSQPIDATLALLGRSARWRAWTRH